jgi:hypothetical protein
MERCPLLENIEIIFNGQKAMFMCKIEDVMIVNQFQIKEKTFKQHIKKSKTFYQFTATLNPV